MRIRFTIDITRPPKPQPEPDPETIGPDVYDLSNAQVENAAEPVPLGFMGQAPQDPWDKRR